MDYWKMAERRLLRRETRNYVPSILASIIVSRHPERYGFVVNPDPPLVFETVPINYQVDLQVVAESLNEPLTTLTQLNPELQRGVTPFADRAYYLKVPLGKGKELLTKLAAIPPEKRLRLKHHKVKQGETLSLISARYGTSIQAIAEVNRIRNIHRLRLGQDLIIPLSGRRVASAGLRAGGRIKSTTGKHTVIRGDSLYQIARLYGVTLADLFRWNDIEPGQHIHPGQEIRVSALTRAPANSAASNAGND
jgi:membrane-bound lytic murein transglycosylase D